MFRYFIFFFSCIFVLGTTTVLSKPSVDDLAKKQFIRIGSGSISGVYYITANAICNFVKKSNKITGRNIFCAVQSTPGAIYNLNSIHKNDMEFGIVQSDAKYVFYHEKKMTELRSVVDIYDEMFVVVVRENSEIKTFDDIENKRVNIGAPGSGLAVLMQRFLQMKKWTNQNFQVSTQLNNSEQVQALCDGKIDVMTLMMSLPNGIIQTADATCGVKLIGINEGLIDKFISDHKYYSKHIIKASDYGGKDDILTFGATAALVARDDVDEGIVYNIVKSLYENFNIFKQSHPALSRLSNKDLLPKDSSVPIHSGALKFYKEVGLLNE